MMAQRPALKSRDVRSDVEGLLRPGERILWSGAPMPGFRLRGAAVVWIILGLPFLCIGLILLVIGPGLIERPVDIIGIVIFVAGFGGFGGYVVFDPILKARITARHVRYALTTAAAIIAKDWPVRRTEVFPILPSSEVTLEDGRTTATVWFHTRKESGAEGDIVSHRSGFEYIPDGESVFRLIRAIQTDSPV
jgi:hypothetical protein